MIIKNLKIVSVDGEEIRSVDFKSGLNLIIDESTNKGNGVGKTTVLRCIDYCFGSDGKDIFESDDGGDGTNYLVKNFLIDKGIKFILEIKSLNGELFVLERSFVNEKSIINGTSFSDEEYFLVLRSILFNGLENKPTLRQLIGKFIRKNDHLMVRPLQYLHSTTTLKVYETIDLTLFGFQNPDLLENSLRIQEKITEIDDRIKKVSDAMGDKDINSIEEAISVIDSKIDHLKGLIDSSNIVEGIEEILSEISSRKNSISKTVQEMSYLKMEIDLNKKSYNELIKELDNIDSSYIKGIYEQALIFIPDLQKSFEDLILFHNSVIKDRASIIEDKMSELEKQYGVLDSYFKTLSLEESNLIDILKGKGLYNDIQKIEERLRQQYELRGKYVKSFETLNKLNEQRNEMGGQKDEYATLISKFIKNVKDNISLFNKHFTDYASKTYSLDYYLYLKDHIHSKTKDKIYQLKFDNVQSNLGTGDKKGLVALYDLAYISYLKESNIDFPRFVCHDNIEQIDEGPLKEIFSIANRSGGQYIVSILKSKISFLSLDEINLYKRISLTRADKFFRIESM